MCYKLSAAIITIFTESTNTGIYLGLGPLAIPQRLMLFYLIKHLVSIDRLIFVLSNNGH